MNSSQSNQKPDNSRRTFVRLLTYLASSRKMLILVFLLVIISIACSLYSSYLMRPIINDYIIPGNINGLIIMIVLLIGIYLVGVAATYIQYLILNRIGQRTVDKLRKDLFSKMETLPISYFDTHKHGDLMSRYTNDMDKVSEVLTDNLIDLITAALTVIGIIVIMLYINPLLTLVTVLMVPLMLFAARLIVTRSKKYFKAQQDDLGQLNGYIEEMISGQKVIKVFAHEQMVIEDFDKLNNKLRQKAEKAQLYSGIMMPIMQSLNTLNFVLVTIIGALLAIFRGFDVGGLAVFLQYSRQFGRPINELAMLYNNLQAAMAGAERIFAILEEPSEPRDNPHAVTLSNIKGSIELQNISFGYSPEKLVLKNISVKIPAGSKVALVGTTGAGKTTIMNLLPRFYDYLQGHIWIDGIELHNIQRQNLRKTLAMVLQDTHLFTGTVADNIRFGRLNATDDEVIAAAKLTSADTFIQHLPQGYQTVLVNDGENLSQGQRQLLSIARAAVSNPHILLLDEATSNIDTRSEVLIEKGLNHLMKGRTSIIIAHRISTIRNADKILVIEKGEIIEQGNHAELIALKGKYHHLYENQFDDQVDFLL